MVSGATTDESGEWSRKGSAGPPANAPTSDSRSERELALITLHCPRCHIELARGRNRIGPYWQCEACSGQAIMVAQVREATGREVFRSLWNNSTRQDHAEPCPSCERGMLSTEVRTNGRSVELDTCRTCQLVWFDTDESDRIAEVRPESKLTPEEIAARQSAVVEMIKFQGEARREAMPEDHRSVFAALGLPVEHRAEFLPTRPWLTWIAAAVIALVFLRLGAALEDAVRTYGFIPVDFGRLGGTTILASVLLHSGLPHLLASVYFLLVFGDDVELALGKLKYVALLLLSTVAGNVFHGVFTNQPNLPTVGASAAVSGILVFYAMAFPQNRVGLITWLRYGHVSARGALLFWVGIQAAVAYFYAGGLAPGSAAIHLGGATVGLSAWGWWHRPRTEPNTAPGVVGEAR